MFPNTQKEMTNSEEANNLPFELGDLIVPVATTESDARILLLVKGVEVNKYANSNDNKEHQWVTLSLEILHHDKDQYLKGVCFSESFTISKLNDPDPAKPPFRKVG